MKPGAAEVMGNPPLSLYPGMRFEAQWDGQGVIPVNKVAPPSARRSHVTGPRVRGWLVLSGGMAHGTAENLPGWTLPWPCRLTDLEVRLSEVWASEEVSRQEWLDQGVETEGFATALALEQPARVVAWLLDRDSANQLGWQGVPGRPVWAAGQADSTVHDEDLQRLAVALAHLVPGAVFRLDSAEGHRAQTARSIVADLLALEQTGRTHGKCLARMRWTELRKLGLPLNSASLKSMGVAL